MWKTTRHRPSWPTSRRYPGHRIFIERVDSPKREPPTYSFVEGTFIVPTICHTKRGWLIFCKPFEQSHHHASIQGRQHSQALLLRSSILRALPVWKTNRGFISTKDPRELKPLYLVHSDICGPIPDQSLSPFISSLTTQLEGVGLSGLDKRSHVHDFYRMARGGRKLVWPKLKCIRSVNRGEYKSDELSNSVDNVASCGSLLLHIV